MPRKKNLKCYFGCVIDGPLHHFPKPQWPLMERFNSWKAVLRPDTQARGDNYLFSEVRLCYRHFEHYYSLPSKLLTRNAFPTLNLGPPARDVEEPSLSLPNAEAPIASTSHEIPTLATTNNYSVENRPPLCDVERHPPVTLFRKTNKTRIKKVVHSHKCNEILRLTMRLKKMGDKCKTQTKRIRKAEKLARSKTFLNKLENLPKSAKIFIKMQTKSKCKARGRRYSLKEKIVSLTILKQSPKGYNFLRSIFALPSKRTLQKLTKLLTIKPGINDEIFQNIKSAVQKYPEERRLVTLMFDEVSLAPGLFYNKSLQEIVGFEDYGTKKTKDFADHALVFMVKGLKGKFKQPVCFTFCKSATKKPDLTNLIKTVIKRIHETGLIVVATVCDQSSTNVATIKGLKDDTKAQYLRRGEEYKSLAIDIDGISFYPLYDPPHLLKGIRNNLLTKNLRYTQNNEVKIAKWEHLEMLLKEDVGEDEIRLVNKLTEAHVYKDKIPKMKVKHAAQVFSQRVSSAMGFLARRNILPIECDHTAQILLIFDKLFDSFNGHSYNDSSKPFKGCLKNGSPHFQLWKELLPVLRSMGFETKKKQNDGETVVKYEKVPSINNFIHNINTIKELWTHLKDKYDICNLLTRNLNQDPIENFFCQIRSNGVRNVNPTANQFTNAYKTLLINNFSSPHSVHANCEQDQNKSLQSIKALLLKAQTRKKVEEPMELDFDLLNNCQSSFRNSSLHAEAKSYVTGFVAKKCRTKIFKKCVTCSNSIFAQDQNEKNDYIKYRDITKHSLNYPSTELKSLMNDIYSTIVTCLRNIPENNNLPQLISLYIDINCDFNFITCKQHKGTLIKFIIELSINIIIHSWCKGVNSILTGKLTNYDKTDPIKHGASVYFNIHKKKK